MFAIVGLGNPGAKYQETRHNAGFWVLEALAKKLKLSNSDFKERGGARYAKTSLAGEDVILVAPERYMNLSGQAINSLVSFFKLEPSNIIVIHDELDLAPGVVRVKLGGSHAGQKGVLDISSVLGSKDFYRVRLGIGHPRDSETQSSFDVSDWVLSKPLPEDRAKFEKAIEIACDSVELLLSEGLEKTQRVIHARS